MTADIEHLQRLKAKEAGLRARATSTAGGRRQLNFLPSYREALTAEADELGRRIADLEGELRQGPI
jgi:hypothetical protein